MHVVGGTKKKTPEFWKLVDCRKAMVIHRFVIAQKSDGIEDAPRIGIAWRPPVRHVCSARQTAVAYAATELTTWSSHETRSRRFGRKTYAKNTHFLRTTSTRNGNSANVCIGLKWIVVVAVTSERFVGEKAIERLAAAGRI